MKNYIIKDKYEGLDTRIAELLKLGKKIKGFYYESEVPVPVKHVGELVNYCHGKKLPFRILKEGGFYSDRDYFEPIFEEETDWSKVPIDTKIIVWDTGGKVKGYFAGLTEKGKIKAWINGETSWTTSNFLEWLHAEIYKEEDK